MHYKDIAMVVAGGFIIMHANGERLLDHVMTTQPRPYCHYPNVHYYYLIMEIQ